MDYRQAKRIRQRSLSDVIAANIVAGETTMGAFRKGISQKTKASFTGLKEKFDPLNIAKALTGGSRLAPALLGRMLGRSQRDIEYFAGTARPLYSPQTTHSRLGGMGGDGEGSLDILTKMYGFLKKTQDNEMRRYEMVRNYQEENKIEDEKRHKELIKALGGRTTTAAPVGETKGKGIFQSILDFFENLKPLFEFFKEVFDIFKKVGLNVVLNLFRMIGNPAFLMVAAGAATIYALRELLFKLAEVTPNMKAMSPAEAQSVLQHGSPKQIEDMGGRAYLEDIIKNQRQRALDAMAMNEGEEKDKTIRQLGGLDKVKAMIADTKVYEVPTEVDKGPEKVAARPKTGGVALKSKQEEWDRKWGATHDPETGKRKDLAPSAQTPEAPKMTPQQIESNVKATPESTPTAGQALTNVTKENQNLNLTKTPTPNTITKTVNNVNQTRKQAPMLNKLDKLSVRNPDETFQKMILYSTRVV